MTDLEIAVRDALAKRLRRGRVQSVKTWDDEAVAEILAAAGMPSGMITADGPDAASALAALKERAERTERLAAEMLATFTEGRNGCSARVSAERIGGWREKLGEQA